MKLKKIITFILFGVLGLPFFLLTISATDPIHEISYDGNDSIIEVGFSPKPPSEDEIAPMSSDVTVVTVTGYDKITPQYQGTIQFDKESANLAGITPFGLYYAYWYIVTKTVYITSTYEVFEPVASKWCGLMGEKETQIGEFFPGYKYSIKKGEWGQQEITMTTWIYEILSYKYENNLPKLPKDTWAPCKKENIQWKYGKRQILGR